MDADKGAEPSPLDALEPLPASAVRFPEFNCHKRLPAEIRRLLDWSNVKALAAPIPRVVAFPVVTEPPAVPLPAMVETRYPGPTLPNGRTVSITGTLTVWL